MNENYRIDPNGVDAILRAKSENEVLTYIHTELLRKYGTAPSIAELKSFYSDENAEDIPGFTSEQQDFAMEKMLEFPMQQTRKLNHAILTHMFGSVFDDGED